MHFSIFSSMLFSMHTIFLLVVTVFLFLLCFHISQRKSSWIYQLHRNCNPFGIHFPLLLYSKFNTLLIFIHLSFLILSICEQKVWVIRILNGTVFCPPKKQLVSLFPWCQFIYFNLYFYMQELFFSLLKTLSHELKIYIIFSIWLFNGPFVKWEYTTSLSKLSADIHTHTKITWNK